MTPNSASGATGQGGWRRIPCLEYRFSLFDVTGQRYHNTRQKSRDSAVFCGFPFKYRARYWSQSRTIFHYFTGGGSVARLLPRTRLLGPDIIPPPCVRRGPHDTLTRAESCGKKQLCEICPQTGLTAHRAPRATHVAYAPLIAPSESSLGNWRLKEQRQEITAPADTERQRRRSNRLSHPTPRRRKSVARLPATRTKETEPQVTRSQREQGGKSKNGR